MLFVLLYDLVVFLFSIAWFMSSYKKSIVLIVHEVIYDIV